ncbi:MAG TPA: MBL fold metallo-hydrolase, partial [Gemmatimonadaceae bacterium]|nr:MBL fold metallo-hydrolase [Gemmatimonadaceae bacterium]
MIFKPYYYFETGCAAYLFGCGGLGKCAVVDAHEEDLDDYAALAAAKGMRITHVIDTHVHADHRSGGPELARRAEAPYCVHESADVALPFTPLTDNQLIDLGNTKVRVLHTPGHTPDSVCLLVTDLKRGTDPWFVLTGDTLFVGDIARPDLAVDKKEGARGIFHSLSDTLLSLPDTCEVWPGHLGGSLCGGPGMDLKICSTIGFERANQPLLAVADEEAFVRRTTSALGP